MNPLTLRMWKKIMDSLRLHFKILVLGIGNTLLQDEGAGIHAIRRLQSQCDDLDWVEFVDGGTLSFTLAGTIGDADNLIVFDAAELMDEPGAVRLFVNHDMDRYLGSGRNRSVHEVGLLDLLAVACLTDSLPARRALIGIQPQEMGWGDMPSDVVAAALPAACELAMNLIEEWRQ